MALSGTGGGFKLFCTGDTDINDASRPIKADDEGEGPACEANGIEYVELQIAIDGLTVVVNPENDWATCLTVEELETIYGPDSPEDLDAGADVRAGFPDDAVERYMPGADSGTFDYFTEVINGEVDAATTYATTNEDDNVLVTGVAGDTNAIGFFGFAYFVENQDKLKAARGRQRHRLRRADRGHDQRQHATPRSRARCSSTRTSGRRRTRPELKAFVDFYLANSQTLRRRGRLHRRCRTPCSQRDAEWEPRRR